MDRRDQRPDAWQSLGGREVSETRLIAASRVGISVARQAGESRNVEAVACATVLCLATNEDCHLLTGSSDRVLRSDDRGRTWTASGPGSHAGAPTGDLQGGRRRRDRAGVCGCQTLNSLLPRGEDGGHQPSSSLFQLGV